jgi:SulP family sulfate permease
VTVIGGLPALGVSVIGHIEAGPPRLAWPVIEWGQWLQLIPFALALALVTMAEGLLVARDYGEKRGYSTHPNRDLMAFGLANIASGTTGGFTIGSSTSRTAAMDQAGSRTQLPGLIAAGATILLVIFGTGLLENIPSPAIGAIVAVAVSPLIGFGELRALWSLRRFEFAVAVTCFCGVLVIGPVGGIAIAFVLALINVARRAAAPAIDILSADDSPTGSLLTQYPGTSTAPGLIVLRFAAPLFFANATNFANAVHRAVTSAPGHELRHLVLDLEAVTDVDVTGSESLRGVIEWLREREVQVHYSRVRPDLEIVLNHYGLLAGISVFGTNRGAIEALV